MRSSSGVNSGHADARAVVAPPDFLAARRKIAEEYPIPVRRKTTGGGQ